MNDPRIADKCTECGHARSVHAPHCWFCACAAFSERRDPSPPTDAGWDDSDEQGTP